MNLVKSQEAMNPALLLVMLCYIGAMQHTSIDVYAYAYCRMILLILLAYCAATPGAKVGSRMHFFASHTAQFFGPRDA
jgi:hypothetical protein